MRRTCRGRRQKAGRGREREAERARRRLRNRIEDERPGALTRPRRRIARFTVAAGERKAASRSELLPEMEKADAHRSIDPLPAKTGSGEQRAHVTPSLDAEFRPCMPVGERADRRAFIEQGPGSYTWFGVLSSSQERLKNHGRVPPS